MRLALAHLGGRHRFRQRLQGGVQRIKDRLLPAHECVSRASTPLPQGEVLQEGTQRDAKGDSAAGLQAAKREEEKENAAPADLANKAIDGPEKSLSSPTLSPASRVVSAPETPPVAAPDIATANATTAAPPSATSTTTAPDSAPTTDAPASATTTTTGTATTPDSTPTTDAPTSTETSKCPDRAGQSPSARPFKIRRVKPPVWDPEHDSASAPAPADHPALTRSKTIATSTPSSRDGVAPAPALPSLPSAGPALGLGLDLGTDASDDSEIDLSASGSGYIDIPDMLSDAGTDSSDDPPPADLAVRPASVGAVPDFGADSDFAWVPVPSCPSTGYMERWTPFLDDISEIRSDAGADDASVEGALAEAEDKEETNLDDAESDYGVVLAVDAELDSDSEEEMAGEISTQASAEWSAEPEFDFYFQSALRASRIENQMRWSSADAEAADGSVVAKTAEQTSQRSASPEWPSDLSTDSLPQMIARETDDGEVMSHLHITGTIHPSTRHLTPSPSPQLPAPSQAPRTSTPPGCSPALHSARLYEEPSYTADYDAWYVAESNSMGRGPTPSPTDSLKLPMHRGGNASDESMSLEAEQGAHEASTSAEDEGRSEAAAESPSHQEAPAPAPTASPTAPWALQGTEHDLDLWNPYFQATATSAGASTSASPLEEPQVTRRPRPRRAFSQSSTPDRLKRHGTIFASPFKVHATAGSSGTSMSTAGDTSDGSMPTQVGSGSDIPATSSRAGTALGRSHTLAAAPRARVGAAPAPAPSPVSSASGSPASKAGSEASPSSVHRHRKGLDLARGQAPLGKGLPSSKPSSGSTSTSTGSPAPARAKVAAPSPRGSPMPGTGSPASLLSARSRASSRPRLAGPGSGAPSLASSFGLTTPAVGPVAYHTFDDEKEAQKHGWELDGIVYMNGEEGMGVSVKVEVDVMVE